MSLAACAKEIICDPTVTMAQAVNNFFEFMAAQVKLDYSTDPSYVLGMQKACYEAANKGTGFKGIIDNIVAVLDGY